MLIVGQSASTRRAALRRFLDGGCPTLLATDVAGQGLNLQSRARWVINLELPWNPMRIEQRIGRVERIGQTRPVHATLMVMRHRMESALLTSLARRTQAAERALGSPVFAIGAPPTDAAVGRSLLTGAPLEMPDAQASSLSISPCTRWSRRARLEATRLLMRRSFARRWRHDGFGCRLPRCRVRSSALAGVAVYVVPLLDPTGAVLERHVVVVALPRPLASGTLVGGPPDTTVPAETAAAALSQVMNARLKARRQRVGRLYHHSVARRAISEHQIARHLHAQCYPEAAQAELFTQRAVRAFDTDRLMAGRITGATERDLDGLDGDVRVGDPSLELIFASR